MVNVKWSKTNVKNSATDCEVKIPGGLEAKFKGDMGKWVHTDGKKNVFENSNIGKTRQDYGNSTTQANWK